MGDVTQILLMVDFLCSCGHDYGDVMVIFVVTLVMATTSDEAANPRNLNTCDANPRVILVFVHLRTNSWPHRVIHGYKAVNRGLDRSWARNMS